MPFRLGTNKSGFYKAIKPQNKGANTDFQMILKLIPANIYRFKINHKNTRKRCEICSKLTKTSERR